MGGRGRKDHHTDRMVCASLREARRKTRVHDPRGDAERFMREEVGLTAEKIL